MKREMMELIKLNIRIKLKVKSGFNDPISVGLFSFGLLFRAGQITYID